MTNFGPGRGFLNSTCCGLFGLMISWGVPAMAHGALVFTLADDGSGGVSVIGQGMGNVDGSASSVQFQYLDFATDFLADTVTSLSLNDTSVTGSLTNLTTLQSAGFRLFALDRDPDSADDLIINTLGVMTFSTGDAFSLTLNANFDAATLASADLIPGTHLHTSGNGLNAIFGPTTVIVAVPEPSSVVVLTALAVWGIHRKRGRRA